MSKKKESVCGGCAKKTSIGGQALIEGIMMRGPRHSAMAVRNPEGEIVLEKWETKPLFRAKFTKLPFIRGLFNFIDSMASGYKCIMRSADIAMLEEVKEEDGAADVTADVSANKPENKPAKKPSKVADFFMNLLMVLSAVLGVALAAVLFLFLPAQIYSWLEPLSPVLEGNRFLRSLIEGILRIALFVLYMAAVTLMKDMRRTFMYHGAEHKTIFCYEHGHELTVENVRRERRFHPRCGTSFMILMLIVGVFVGMLIPSNLSPLIRTAIKILLLPISVGIGYELIKLAGRHDNAFTRFISAPGVWLQHITTIEPDDDMIECAIRAFVEVIPEDEKSDNF